MGTNYYFETVEGKPCPTCGKGDGQVLKLHIGKSSAGWPFSLHGYKGRGDYDDAPVPLDSWQRWKTYLVSLGRRAKIFDEYDREVPLTEFINLVEWKNNTPMPEHDSGSRFDDDGYRLIFQEFS